MCNVIRLCLICSLFIGCERAPKGASQSAEVSRLQEEQRQQATTFMKTQQASDDPKPTPAPTPEPKAVPAQAPPRPSPQPKVVVPSMTKNEIRRLEITTSASQLAENGLLTMESLLKEHTPGPNWKAAYPYLEQSAAYTSMKRRAHWRVAQNSDWRALKKLIGPVLSRYSTKSAKRRGAVHDILTVAVEMISRKDGYERATGYSLLNECFKQLGDKLTNAEKAKYLGTMVAQFDVANKIHERQLLLTVIGAHGDRTFDRFLVRVALDDAEWTARREALLALDACMKMNRGCSLDVDTAQLVHDTHSDSRTRGPLYRVAGRAQVPNVAPWCADHLDTGNLTQSCRSALSLVGTRDAFEALYGWLKKRKDEPGSSAVGQYTFREEFKTITPYADFHYAKERYYTLLLNVLGQDVREPHATGGIVRTMDQLKDYKRALYIVTSTIAFYEAKWEKIDKQRGHNFLFKELRKMKSLLARRVKSDKRWR